MSTYNVTLAAGFGGTITPGSIESSIDGVTDVSNADVIGVMSQIQIAVTTFDVDASTLNDAYDIVDNVCVELAQNQSLQAVVTLLVE